MVEQHRILNQVADLIDQGCIRTTTTRTLSPISSKTMREAYALVESGRTIGKVVVDGWQ
ncbi:zinc-binding dehydrogenase [Actinomycetaceae bacterium L2_0104]